MTDTEPRLHTEQRLLVLADQWVQAQNTAWCARAQLGAALIAAKRDGMGIQTMAQLIGRDRATIGRLMADAAHQ